MGLLINQGKQTISDNSIIETNDAVCQIIKIELNNWISGALDITFKIIAGDPRFVGRTFKDLVSYEPTSISVWKYQALRKFAGVPYEKDEPAEIDIEKLLMNKCISCDLSKRLDKKGEERQTCKYKKLSDEMKAKLSTAPASSDDGWGDNEHEFTPVDSDEKLPF